MENALRRHFRVVGRVQGVWYRASARDKAVELGLNGWVRNLPDGSVEAVAQGQRAAVEAFEAWLHEGPPVARVDRVDASEETPGHDLGPFTVR